MTFFLFTLTLLAGVAGGYLGRPYVDAWVTKLRTVRDRLKGLD